MKLYPVFLTILWLTLISLVACQPNSTTILAKSALQPKGSWFDWIRGSATVPTPPQTSRPCFANIPPTTNHPPYWLLATAANTGDLKEANNDALRFKKAMQKRYSIPDQQICVLDNVYRQELVEALQVLKARVTDKDLAIIYFSGHGSTIDQGSDENMIDEVLVTYDAQDRELTKTAPCDSYVLRDKSFVALVNDLPTARVLTVIDACFSGGMYMPPTIDHLPEARLKYFVGDRCLSTQLPSYKTDTAGKLDKLKGLLLSASAEHEYAQAWEIPGGGGIFTTKLVEALAQAPLGKFQDAFKRTAEQVFKTVHQLKPDHPQQPKASSERWDMIE
jgi:Caspase domain